MQNIAEIIKPVEKSPVVVSEKQTKNFLYKVAGDSEENIKSKIENANRSIANAKESLANNLRNLDHFKIMLKALKDSSKFNLAEKLQYILDSNKKITKIEVDDNGRLVAYTIPLIARALNGGRYLVGPYKIQLDPKNAAVKFFSLDQNYVRRSHWGSNCQHPHVSNNGDGCLGNSSEPIAVLTAGQNYSDAFDICISFLEQANTDDPAGACVANWDKILPDGTIVRGCIDLSSDCFKYGKTPEEDRFKRRCAHSGNLYNEKELEYIEEFDEWIYPEYKEKRYTICKECGKYAIRSTMFITSDGQEICEHCRNEKYAKCEQCGKWHLKEETVTFTEDGKEIKMCKACYEALPICMECGERHLSLETVFIDGEEKFICPDCLDSKNFVFDDYGTLTTKENLYKCPECGRILALENFQEAEDGKHVCVRCNKEVVKCTEEELTNR